MFNNNIMYARGVKNIRRHRQFKCRIKKNCCFFSNIYLPFDTNFHSAMGNLLVYAGV